MDKGKAKEVDSPSRAYNAHGKDSKLLDLVSKADQLSGPKELESTFEAKKIGKKAVFRAILQSPFNARWWVVTKTPNVAERSTDTPFYFLRPDMTPVIQDVLLHSLLHLLQTDNVQKHFKRENLNTPRRSARKTKEKNKRRKARLALQVLQQQGFVSSLATEESLRTVPTREAEGEDVGPKEKPILCGLNNVTRQLESAIREKLESASAGEGEGSSLSSSIKHKPTIVFVCQADVNPPTLVSHFPLLCATYNAVTREDLYLIKLPKDAESKLSEATSLRRCSVLSVDAALLSQESDAGRSLQEMLAKIRSSGVEAMRMGWLDDTIAAIRGQKANPARLMEPRIKHMRSSALLNLNTAKAEKKAARKAAIQERRKRRLSNPEGLESQRQKSKKDTPAKKGKKAKR